MYCFKHLIVILLLNVYFLHPAFAKGWTEVKSQNSSIKAYINEDNIQKNNITVIYTLRFKDKNIGDYINVVQSNCSDFSTAVLATYEYDKNLKIDYSSILSISMPEYKQIDDSSILYNAASIACVLPSNTKNFTEIKKTESNKKSTNEKSLTKKIISGVGDSVLFVVCLPFAILNALLTE